MAPDSGVWSPSDTPVDHLILDMLAWLAAQPRSYEDAMQTWRTSCPRLTVWEDAFDAGLVERRTGETHTMIRLTERGIAALRNAGR
jgi:hypothetical protein